MVRAGKQEVDFKEQVISINRVTKVVKGGKNLSFCALVVLGDQNGKVGFGMGKAKEVPSAIRNWNCLPRRGTGSPTGPRWCSPTCEAGC